MAELSEQDQVCACYKVTKGDIVRCGGLTVGEVSSRTRAGLNGHCTGLIAEIVAQQRFCPSHHVRVGEVKGVIDEGARTTREVERELGCCGCDCCSNAFDRILRDACCSQPQQQRFKGI
eukprot:m51a1_g6288 putative nitrite reductase (119) ;mRNA; r:246291-246808